MVTGIRVSRLSLFAHLKEYFNIFTKMFKLGLFSCDFDSSTVITLTTSFFFVKIIITFRDNGLDLDFAHICVLRPALSILD